MKIKGKKFLIIPALKNSAEFYCKNTSLHGFHYITNEKLSYRKSFFWTCVCITSAIFSLYLIYLQLLRFENNRITTTITTTSYPIWKIPFPAVTICNFNVVHKERVSTFRDTLKDYNFKTDAIDDFFQNLSSLILNDYLSAEVDWDIYAKIEQTLKNIGYDTEQLMRQLAHPCTSLLKQCSWKNKEVPCQEIFQSIKTTSGFCCSFNYKGVTQNFQLKFNEENYVKGVGANFGLQVYLDIEASQYMSSIKPNYGIDVLIHESYEFPDVSLKSNTIYSKQKLSIGLQPELISSDESIRGVNYKKRECLFEDERSMIWSRRYSFSTCMSECRAKAILTFCGCIPFYYPIQNGTKFCTLTDLQCLQKSEDIYNNLRVVNTYTDEATSSPEHDIHKINCDCFLQCNEITYKYHIDQQQTASTVGFDTIVNASMLSVYFGEMGCNKFTRSIYFTWDTLLATIGGIFGLCLGGSILSIIELFYLVLSKKSKSTAHKTEPKIYLTELYPNLQKHRTPVINMAW